MTEVKELNTKHRINIIDLLQMYNLPTSDINLNNQHFWGIYDDSKLIACGALEIKDQFGVLRSLAVDNDFKNKGFGKLIYHHIINQAKKENLSSLFLLTLSAPEYFNKMGFKRIKRNTVPEAINTTEEFKTLCPSSAICMELKL